MKIEDSGTLAVLTARRCQWPTFRSLNLITGPKITQEVFHCVILAF